MPYGPLMRQADGFTHDTDMAHSKAPAACQTRLGLATPALVATETLGKVRTRDPPSPSPSSCLCRVRRKSTRPASLVNALLPGPGPSMLAFGLQPANACLLACLLTTSLPLALFVAASGPAAISPRHHISPCTRPRRLVGSWHPRERRAGKKRREKHTFHQVPPWKPSRSLLARPCFASWPQCSSSVHAMPCHAMRHACLPICPSQSTLTRSGVALWRIIVLCGLC